MSSPYIPSCVGCWPRSFLLPPFSIPARNVSHLSGSFQFLCATAALPPPTFHLSQTHRLAPAFHSPSAQLHLACTCLQLTLSIAPARPLCLDSCCSSLVLLIHLAPQQPTLPSHHLHPHLQLHPRKTTRYHGRRTTHKTSSHRASQRSADPNSPNAASDTVTKFCFRSLIVLSCNSRIVRFLPGTGRVRRVRILSSGS